MFEVRPPTADDFRNIELNDYDAVLRPEVDALADQLAEISGSYSLAGVDGDKVICIGGILPNGEAWMFFAKDCRRYMLRIMARLREMVIDFGLTKGDVWAIIDPARPNARRWAAVLGFDQVEGSDIWRISFSTL